MPVLLLAGAGHAHLAVLRALRRACPAGWHVVLVEPQARINYSGMLPGWLAGHYSQAEIGLSVAELLAGAPVLWRRDTVIAVDAEARRVVLGNGQSLDFDLLSLAVGGQQAVPACRTPFLLPLRPLAGFMAAWQDWLRALPPQACPRIAVAGGGAAAVEVVMAVQTALKAWPGSEVSLLAQRDALLAGHADGVRAACLRQLQRKQIHLLDARLTVNAAGEACAGDQPLALDLLILATGSQAPGWLTGSGLALDAHGFVLADAGLRSISHPVIYAAGDVCTRQDMPHARSGVHAVRAGPVLAANLLACMRGEVVRARYVPRRASLYLLACGSRHALASWGRWHASGALWWYVKRWIDRRFLRQQRTAAMSLSDSPVRGD
ncbi:FAD-dependent oxidoreductase [Chitinilyticum litopenaei]|uniref:FAD-dependent oxidoreductase n=1 Tax=Chitinilyticum litopenaei TaxID=1121276 RepID=UPI0004010318|nr:FAD-dependent oxidoreductase [Chitinilyticum litopenaei]